MDCWKNEKWLLAVVTILGVIVIGESVLQLTANVKVPGLSPITSALFWTALWQLFHVRGKFPGGIYTFLYLLIIVLNLAAGISQIWVAIR